MSHPRKDFEIYGKEITVTVGEKSGSSAFLGEYDGKTAYIAGYNSGGDKLAAKTCAVIERGGEEIPVVVPAEFYGGDPCFECNLLHDLGDLVREGDTLYPKFEKTGGAVMFTEKDGERRYLLIKNNSGHIGFPKGHIDYGETELETAKREVFEETGLDFVQYGDFRREYTYMTHQKTVKTGVFFIGHYDYRKPTIQEDEILDDWLLPYGKAMELLNFPEDRELLEEAEKYISEKN